MLAPQINGLRLQKKKTNNKPLLSPAIFVSCVGHPLTRLVSFVGMATKWLNVRSSRGLRASEMSKVFLFGTF